MMIRAENHGQDRAGGTGQVHHVERVQLRIRGREAAGMITYFATSLAIENVVSAPRHQQLLADLDDLVSLVGLESGPPCCRFLGGLCAGVHRYGDIGLRQRRRIVCAVAGHRHQPAG